MKKTQHRVAGERKTLAGPEESEDLGCRYAGRGGKPLTRVAEFPSEGEYVFNSGVHIFNRRDAHRLVEISVSA